jgi:hypothetical protein
LIQNKEEMYVGFGGRRQARNQDLCTGSNQKSKLRKTECIGLKQKINLFAPTQTGEPAQSRHYTGSNKIHIKKECAQSNGNQVTKICVHR